MKITLTGASGFIGQKLVPFLKSKGHSVTAISRSKSVSPLCTEIILPLESLTASDFPTTDTFIHLAGLAHNKAKIDQNEYHRINTMLPKQLAQLAAAQNVKQFIFLSTSKVHGEESIIPFTAESPFNPLDIYSETKANAEIALQKVSESMNIVSIRPPVVYGKDSKANIAALANACKNNKFLPLPATENRRSFLFIGNLCSAIEACLENPSHGCYQGFVVDDGYAISTEDLVMAISQAVSSKPKIVKVPNLLLSTTDTLCGKIIGRKPFRPLYSNFELDSTDFCETYNWSPPFNHTESIQQSFE